MARNRIEEVDILRGIAAILMILGHSFIVYPVDISTVPWCHWIGHFIYTFHMELFFVPAGAVYHCSNYKIFIGKKIKRILVPYVFFGVITLLLKAFGGSAINGVESTKEGIMKFLFHGGNYWFLYVLFITFAIYPWIEKICRTWQAEAILAACVLIIRQFTQITTFFAIGTLLYYLPYFVFGKIVAQKIHGGGTAPLSRRIKIVVLSVATVLYCSIDFAENKSGVEFGLILSFVRAISIITILYIVVHDVLKRFTSRGAVYSVITDCGTYSLQLYLFNGFLLTALRIVICNVLHITTPVLIAGGIWIGNLVITLVACKYIIPRIPVLKDLCGLK